MNRQAWLTRRRKGIGGSDIGAIVGLDPYRGPMDVYLDKVGEAIDQGETPDMERGRALEPIVKKRYAKATQRKLAETRGVVAHSAPRYHFAIGTPDAFFHQLTPRAGIPGNDMVQEHGQYDGVLEVKTMRVRPFSRAKREGLPAHHVAQLQWYLGILGFPIGAFALFSAELWELVAFDVEANPETQRSLFQAGETFWQDCIVPQKPPTASWGAPVPVDIAKSGAEVLQLESPELRAALDLFRAARELRDEGAELLEGAKAEVKATMPGYGVVRCGAGLVHFRQQEGRRTLDKKALAAARPIDREKLFAALAALGEDGDVLNALQQMEIQGHNLTIDLALFEKLGNPFDTLKVYFPGEKDGGE